MVCSAKTRCKSVLYQCTPCVPFSQRLLFIGLSVSPCVRVCESLSVVVARLWALILPGVATAWAELLVGQSC